MVDQDPSLPEVYITSASSVWSDVLTVIRHFTGEELAWPWMKTDTGAEQARVAFERVKVRALFGTMGEPDAELVYRRTGEHLQIRLAGIEHAEVQEAMIGVWLTLTEEERREHVNNLRHYNRPGSMPSPVAEAVHRALTGAGREPVGGESFWLVSPKTDGDGHLFLDSRDGFWEAQVRRDGCFELTRSHNHPLAGQTDWDDVDHIHVCDVNGLDDMMDDMRAAAMAWFDHPWP